MIRRGMWSRTQDDDDILTMLKAALSINHTMCPTVCMCEWAGVSERLGMCVFVSVCVLRKAQIKQRQKKRQPKLKRSTDTCACP